MSASVLYAYYHTQLLHSINTYQFTIHLFHPSIHPSYYLYYYLLNKHAYSRAVTIYIKH